MKIQELFARLSGTHVAFIPNEGNCGDGLIHMGFAQLCAQYAISYTSLLHPRPARGRVLLVLACGNLCRPFHYQVARIRRYAPCFERTYLLPCSIDPAAPAVAELLETLPPSVTIFCREEFSFDAVASYLRNGNEIYLDHDLSLAVDFEPWKRRGSGKLNAFRTDLESCGHPPPSDNIDISLWGGSADGELLLRTVAEYETVHTDRAHVAICAAMLDKETHVYPNNYHKVRGIFEYSLRGKSNVVFHETFPSAITAGGSGTAPASERASCH